MRPPRLPRCGIAGRTILAATLLAAGSCHRAPPPDANRPAAGTLDPARLDTGRLGAVRVHAPTGDARAIVLLFSGAGGWSSAEDDLAATMAARGAIVAGVDLPAYRAALDASEGECLYLLSEVESLSQQVQRALDVPRYRTPVVAGAGEAGTLALAMLAQSPAATLGGAVAVDPSLRLRTRLPLCEGAAARRTGDGFAYDAKAPLPGFVALGFSAGAEAAGREHAKQALGHNDLLREASGQAASPSPAALLQELVAAGTARPDPHGADIPGWLIEIPASAPSRSLAIVLSGDGGWRDLDKTVAEALHERGIHVVGWDSLRYFWDEKTPERLAADLDALVRRSVREWSIDEVLLVGYSFGADVLPFAYNRMAGDTHALVRQVSLLAVSPSADFEFHVTGWLGAKSDDARPTAPELARMPADRLQCFYGEEDEEEGDSACPGLAGRGVEVVRTSGGHHFDGDYDALATRILNGLAHRRRAEAGPR